jgi:hypothetical protein
MDIFVQILLEIIPAALCFVLVRFMMKTYLFTGETRYVGLPFGFAFLGMSYLFMAIAFSSNLSRLPEEMKWVGLFSEAYAFAFLALTYYFSGKSYERNTRLWWQSIFSGLIVAIIISFVIVFAPPVLTLPTYQDADRYLSGLEIVLASYIVFCTLRNHALKPDPKTIWAPIGYALLAFAEYSSLIWSLDSSISALVGAYLIRITGLLVFLYLSYQVFVGPPNDRQGKRNLK